MKAHKQKGAEQVGVLNINDTLGSLLYFYNALLLVICKQSVRFAYVAKGMRSLQILETARKHEKDLVTVIYAVFPDWPNKDTQMVLELCKHPENPLDCHWRLSRARILIPAICPREKEKLDISVTFCGSFPESFKPIFSAGTPEAERFMREALCRLRG